MANSEVVEKGLHVERVNQSQQIVLDPDNAFWGVIPKSADSDSFIPKTLLNLYSKKKESCDREMSNFRFNSGLTAVYIDPTDCCNARCSYCYIPAKRRKKGRSMTKAELDKALAKISKYFKKHKRTPVIIFHAAEPLLVKDVIFHSIVKFKDELYFGIQTNALLLEEEDVKFIKDNKVSIGISIDAPDSLTNNRLRLSAKGSGNFEKAAWALECFRGYKGLNVITTITKTNLKKLPALVRFLHKKGVRCVLMNPVRLTEPKSRRLRPSDKEMAKYFLKAVDQAIKCSIYSKPDIIIGNFTNVVLAIVAPSARRLMCDISPCGGGRTFFTVTASGDMIPCGEFVSAKGVKGGNIYKDSIEKALASRAFKRIRSRYVEKIDQCNQCLYRNICGAPCPAELNSMGNMYPVRSTRRKGKRCNTSNGMYQKAIFCEFYKEIIGYAFKLIAQGREKYVLRKDSLKNLSYQYNLT